MLRPRIHTVAQARAAYYPTLALVTSPGPALKPVRRKSAGALTTSSLYSRAATGIPDEPDGNRFRPHRKHLAWQRQRNFGLLPKIVLS